MCLQSSGASQRFTVSKLNRTSHILPDAILPGDAKMRSLLLLTAASAVCASPLWDYVHKDDGAFAWRDTGKTLHGGPPGGNGSWTGYLLNVTSQAWLTPADFVGPFGHIWTHQVLVVVPDVIHYTDAAALWITGGGNDGAPDALPDASDEDVLVCASMAVTVGTVCSVLYQIPNAPIVFAADPLRKSRSEDAAVAFTWAQYMLHDRARPEWVLYFPMAKAGIKAMDATTEFMRLIRGNEITRWVTAGASKRGATTWFTGAVDKRIIGIAPIVFDVLSFKAGVSHMWQTLGNWTFACACAAPACLRGQRAGAPPPLHPPSPPFRAQSPTTAT